MTHEKAKLIGRIGGMAARGERKGSAKLTEQKVREIRASDEPSRVVAAQYGIHHTHVGDIRRREVWKHVQ